MNREECFKIQCNEYLFVPGSHGKWAYCYTEMIAGESVQVCIPGQIPYTQTVYICPECSNTQIVNDYGNLDGIKNARKSTLPKKIKMLKTKSGPYRLLYCFQDRKAQNEYFGSRKAMRERACGLELNVEVIKESICKI